MAKSGAPRVGFLGAGQMATALARGWLAAGLLKREQLLAGDPLPAARERFLKETGVAALDDNRAVVAHCDFLLLAVKPQQVREVLDEIRSGVGARHCLVSIVAGVSLGLLAERLGPECRLVRVMPNTPCLVGASASAYTPGPTATEEDIHLVERFLGAVGRAVRLPEKLLDAVTGLSGSGPAFIYVMIEALSDGGVRMGLPRDVANLLAAQTVLGAARMVLETGLHPGALKDAVASPAGTTIAGLHALERGGVRAALMNAVEAATLRCMELGRT
jgi:pyrroline-5-carboxylate reductase